MIRITPDVSMHFPVFTITQDGCAVLYMKELELTTAVGKRSSIGQLLAGYVGMRIIDNEGRFFRIFRAIKGRDLGPLYPGFNLGRLLFRTRRIEADLTVDFIRKLSIEEGKSLIVEVLPSIRRSVEAAGGRPELLESAVSGAASFADLVAALERGGLE